MNTIEKFFINKSQYIDIAVPENKFNYYYKPDVRLSKFDEISVLFHGKNEEIAIGFEMIDIVIEDLRDACLRILDSKATLPDSLNVGMVGSQFNFDTRNEADVSLYLNFFVWSGKLMPTFLYEKNGKIYLEISPLYPWFFEKPKKEERFIAFEEFMKTYKSITVEIPTKAIIKHWLLNCEKIINTIELNHAQRNAKKAS